MKTVGNRIKTKSRLQDYNWLAKKLNCTTQQIIGYFIVTRLAHFSNKSAILWLPACVHLRKTKTIL